jgi:DNA-binding transcriptional ArsR family regulator
MATRTREIITNKKLSSSARLALLWLRATAKNGCSYETNSSIGEALGLASASVSELGRELSDAGLVRREGAGKGSGMAGRKRWILMPTIALALLGMPHPADSHLGSSTASTAFPETTVFGKGGRRRKRRPSTPVTAGPIAAIM